MTCNRFNFIHASIVFAKKLNTHPLAEPSEKKTTIRWNLVYLDDLWTITHALCVDIQQNRNSLVRKTPNKFLYSQQKSFSCTQKERFFEILCKIGSLGCLTKCSKGHLRIANGTYSLISQNILLSIIRYFTKFFFE